MKEINLAYFESKGRIYIPFDEHLELIKDLQNEKERLNNIIKEVREIISKKGYYHLTTDEIDYILEILDKVDKENNNEDN